MDIILFMLMFEAFASIFSSLCILWPLAVLRNPDNPKVLFKKYFLIRATILLIGTFIFPIIGVIDFMGICLGAQIVELLKENHEKKLSNTLTETLEETCQINPENHNVIDEEQIKEELIDILKSYKNAYITFDFDTLRSICTNNFFYMISNKLSLLKISRQK